MQCSLSKTTADTPVVDWDGHVYDYRRLQEWRKCRGWVSPHTGRRWRENELRSAAVVEEGEGCGRQGCCGCASCALGTLACIVPQERWPKKLMWPLLVERHLKFAQRIGWATFVYANGAWQDFKLFCNLIEPYCASDVDIPELWVMCNTREEGRHFSAVSTAYSNGPVQVELPSLRVQLASEFNDTHAGRMAAWDFDVYSRLWTNRTMPSWQQGKDFLCLDDGTYPVKPWYKSDRSEWHLNDD